METKCPLSSIDNLTFSVFGLNPISPEAGEATE